MPGASIACIKRVQVVCTGLKAIHDTDAVDAMLMSVTVFSFLCRTRLPGYILYSVITLSMH